MPRLYASGVVPAEVGRVWRVVRDFNGMPAWHPGIATSEIEPGPTAGEPGAIRRMTLSSGGVVREILLRLDDLDRGYTYQIKESPFPIRSYVSTIRVTPVTIGGQSFVEWSCDYDADAGDETKLSEIFVQDVYTSGIAALASYFGG